MEQGSVLEMRGIYKTFPGVKALQNVDFTLKKGEIHALMGENGAGKSTLIKVLTGVEGFETGQIMIDGIDHAIINRSPQEAQQRGISTVYQEVNLCPNLSVAENLFIGRAERSTAWKNCWPCIRKRTRKQKRWSCLALAFPYSRLWWYWARLWQPPAGAPLPAFCFHLRWESC